MASDDPFLLHLVDSEDWVADHERNMCNVCTRPFGTFRRKHHCRMCGEVVCKHCTLYKDVHMSSTVGTTHVRVCMSCLINCASQHSRGFPNAASTRRSTALEAQRLWQQNHLLSPISGPSSDLESEELPLRSLTLKPRQHFELEDDHLKAGCQPFESKDNYFQANNEANPSCKRYFKSKRHSNDLSSDWAHPWPQPPVSVNENDRLRALRALNVLDSESEKPFDMICDLAKTRLSCPMAAVGFLDEHRQWFKASVGLAHKVIPRKIAFCTYAVYASESMVVLDTLQDDRFKKNPLVAGAAGIRFYAAAPIIDSNSGYAVGSVFVLDTRPREACDISILERLAIAASENLLKYAIAETVSQGKNEEDNNAIDNAEQQLQFETAHKATTSVHGAGQYKVQGFHRKKLKVPISPAASITTSSMSSFASSNQVCLSPSKRNQEENKSMSTARFSTTAVEQMEELLMRLLTQNTETQQQLTMQQIILSTKLGEHTDQITKLISDFDRIKAKVEAKREDQCE